MLGTGDHGRYAHADAHVAAGCLAVWQGQRGNCLDHSVGNLQCALGTGHGGNKHKLFTAVARHSVTGAADRGGQGLCNLPQAGVTGRVAVVVVVAFEPVHIEYGQGQGLALAHGALPFLLQDAVEMTAVGDAGQAVGEAQGFQLAVEQLQFIGALRYPLFQLAFGAFQGVHQLLLCVQQLFLHPGLVAAHDVEAVGQGEGQQEHFQRRAELNTIHGKGIGGDDAHGPQGGHCAPEHQQGKGGEKEIGAALALDGAGHHHRENYQHIAQVQQDCPAREHRQGLGIGQWGEGKKHNQPE